VAGVGDSECVGGVEVVGEVVESEDGTEDGGDLFLGGVAVAGDVLFDDGGFVFGDREVSGDGSGDGYALGATELKHGLYVFAEEGGLDGEVVGVEGVDDAGGGEEDVSDAEVEFWNFLEVEDIHGLDCRSGAVGVEEAVAQNLGAGVDAED